MADEWRENRVIEPGWGVGHEREVDKGTPDQLLDMQITPDLKRMYQGFTRLLAM